MTSTPTPAPNFAYRLAIILAGLAALIARRFARDPFQAAFIRPLWKHLTRAARRLEGAFARLAANLPSRPRAAKSRSGPHSKPAFPTRPAWLVRALGSEAAAYASQLKFLLAEPEAAAALANSLAARRTLAPIRRMLGLTPPRPRRPRVRVRPQPPPAPVAAPRPTPPAWMREYELPPSAHLQWMPPRRFRSG